MKMAATEPGIGKPEVSPSEGQSLKSNTGAADSVDLQSTEGFLPMSSVALAPYVVAVIPAHNEERFIGSVVVSARQCARRVIVVDDGSEDRTAAFARAAGAEVMSLGVNRGKGAALNVGFERARELNAAVVVCLDADAQHDAAEIPLLVRPILEDQADVVIGSRFLDTQSSIPAWRRVGQHTLTRLTNATSGTTSTDSQSGFRAFSPEALKKLHFRSRGLAMESEMQFLIERSALRVLEVPISVQYLDGNKRNPVVHGLEVIEAILGLVVRRRPLAFLSGTGTALMVAGFCVGLYVVNTVEIRHVVLFGTAILSSLLIIVGMLLAVTGLILNSLEHFLRRIEDEIHRGFASQRSLQSLDSSIEPPEYSRRS